MSSFLLSRQKNNSAPIFTVCLKGKTKHGLALPTDLEWFLLLPCFGIYRLENGTSWSRVWVKGALVSEKDKQPSCCDIIITTSPNTASSFNPDRHLLHTHLDKQTHGHDSSLDRNHTVKFTVHLVTLFAVNFNRTALL